MGRGGELRRATTTVQRPCEGPPGGGGARPQVRAGKSGAPSRAGRQPRSCTDGGGLPAVGKEAAPVQEEEATGSDVKGRGKRRRPPDPTLMGARWRDGRGRRSRRWRRARPRRQNEEVDGGGGAGEEEVVAALSAECGERERLAAGEWEGMDRLGFRRFYIPMNRCL
ncbi:hypothetical protein BS78_05G110200 [Paspalum vaginatum]|nr:hypothetical protein BS78_05G110200 [Paspalum vaginatum]